MAIARKRLKDTGVLRFGGGMERTPNRIIRNMHHPCRISYPAGMSDPMNAAGALSTGTVSIMPMANWISKVLWGCVAAVVIVLQTSVAAAADDEQAFRVPLGERQLFLDDVGIATIDNLKRTMHQPAKRGAVIVPDQPWETTLQTRCAPVWDEERGVYQIWMITSTNIPGVAGTTYAESKDGLRWTKPVLGQRNIEDSSENNFISVVPGDAWPENGIENVVYDPDEPDRLRRYKGFYGVINRKPMVSADGIRWKLLDAAVLPSSDESNLSYDREHKTFIATLKRGGPFGRSQGIWTSHDFTKWQDTGVLFHADELDQVLGRKNIKARRADPTLQIQSPLWDIRDSYKGHTAEPKVDVYNIGLFRYEGLYVGAPAMFHSNDNRWNKDGFHLIQLVCSRDLKTFKRLGGRQTFIGPSPIGKGAYDLTQLIGPSAPVIRGDELWFYYSGIKYRARPKNVEHITGAICLAVLRRDGFVSLDSGDTEGTILTRPFELLGSQLFVNVDAPMGELRVEMLDGAGKVVAQSKPLSGDLLREPVTWADCAIAKMKTQNVSLRFTLRCGQFYSYWLE